MRIKGNVLKKIVSVLSSALLLINSFTPYLLVLPVLNPVGAQEEISPTQEPVPTPSEEVTPEVTVQPTVEVSPEVTPTAEVTSEPTLTPVITTEVTPEISPTIVELPLQSVQDTTPTPNPLEVTNSPSPPSPTPTEVISTPDINGVVETTLVESYTCRADSLNGCLVTDKPDYAPTEAAVITGHGFSPTTIYTLRVTSADEPAVDSSYQITTDENGSFTYSYQLDGTYRPNYLVQITDSSGFVLASVTFTDTKPVTLTDTPTPILLSATSSVQTAIGSCVEDAYGSNLNCTANDVSIANVTGISVSDPCDYPGDTTTFTATWDVQSTATQRYNVGLYFASQGQTSALNGSCSVSSLSNSPVPPNYNFDGNACGDISSASMVHPIITMTVQCEDPDGNNLLNLPYCTSWNQNSNENLLCSSPSDTIPGAPSKCNCQDGFTIPIVVPFGAHIEVIKDLNPSNDSGRFNLQVDGSTASTSSCVGDTGTTGSVSVGAGTSANPGATHTVGETACTDPNTNLSDYTSSISCVNRGLTTYHGGAPLTASGVGPLSVGVVKDDDIVCTISNSQKQGTLIVKKVVVNDNGGIKKASDFSFQVDGGSVVAFTAVDDSNGQNDLTVNAGTYLVTEPAVAGYTTTYDNCSSVVVPAGGSATCTITNNDQPSTLIVKKVVVNDNGGSKKAEDFTFKVNNGAAVAFEADGQNDLTVSAGAYSVTEPSVTGYTTTYDNCSNVVIANGGSATCTISNNDDAAHLIVVKHVVNNAGGTAVASNFTMTIHDVTATGGNSFAGSEAGIDKTLTTVGSYSVTESGLTGYSPSSSADCSGTIALGQTKTCTFSNTDIAPKLTLVKEVGNNYGGTKGVNDFGLTIGGVSVNSGETKTLVSGTSYVLNEAVSTGYGFDSITGNAKCPATLGGTVTLSPGDDITCTITNNDIQPKLTITKIVVNDNGGTKIISDFPLFVNSTSVVSGVQNGFSAGNYTVSETSKIGYSETITGDCASNGTVTLHVGDVKSCTITNDDIAPKLHLRKVVTNNNGGGATVTNFTLKADGAGTNDISGTSPVDSGAGLQADTFALSETNPGGYTGSDWVCVGGTQNSANITVGIGGEATCTITNDDQAPHLIVIKNVINDNGGTKEANDFLTTISGVTTATPTADGAESPGVNNILTTVGAYSVDEGAHAGYNKTLSADCSGTIALGETKTCTITNDDIQPKLTVTKIVTNNNGGTKVVSDFPLFVNSTGVTSGVQNGFNVGPHTISETSDSGYTEVISGDCASNGAVTLALGDVKSCTITNDDIAPQLTLVKEVLNNHGGSAVANAWTLSATGPTTISGAGGVTSGSTFFAGDYTLSESAGPSGYTDGSWSCTNEVTVTDDQITLGLGESTTCTIYNEDQPATLIVKKHVINDNGGTKTAADFSLSVDGTEAAPSTFIGSEDGVSVTLDSGEYSVSETAVDGYVTSYENTCEGTIANGQTITCTVTNDDNYGNVIVTKFNDKNGNGIQDQGENNLSDWEITLSGHDNKLTDNEGLAQFNQILPGDYRVGEEQQNGWRLTGINCSTNIEPTETPIPTPTEVTPTPECEDGQDCEPTITATPTVAPSPTPTPKVGKMNICHYQASSGKWNAQQISDSAWATHQTHGDGTYHDYLYGGPTAKNGHPAPHIGEEWCRTNFQSFNIFGISQVNAQDSEQISTTENITVEAGQTVNCLIGNQQINPKLYISKSNNGIDNSQGGTVIYTLTIKALDSKILGVKVKDLLPKGFSFKNVISIIGNRVGDITAIVGDPQYHSPGTYNLGDMEENDEIVIKYQATISGSQALGLYKDAAWAQGTDVLGNKILALAQEGKVDTNFVGTAVRVNGTLTEEGNTDIGEVLGASTSLPATGANPAWLMIALMLLIIGAISVAFGLMFKKSKSILIVLLMVMSYLFIGGNAFAADVSIRLSEPKTPSRINNYTIDFVALDLSNSGADLLVKCFYKKNLGDGWTQYGPDITVAAPGNSGSCQEVSSIVNASENIYYFKATADGVDSETVSVTYDDRDPGAPTSYHKEKSGCEYKIFFKTADDAQTTRVEIYRSDLTNMALNGTTKVGDVSIGPNTEGTYSQTVSDCNKTYYYIVRAFNAAGNASGPIGDSVTISSSSTTSTSTTEGAIPVVNVTLPGGATSGEGSVLGEETKEGTKEAGTKEEVINVNKPTVTGSVKGAFDYVKTHKKISLGVVLGLGIIGYGIYVFKKRKQV